MLRPIFVMNATKPWKRSVRGNVQFYQNNDIYNVTIGR
jgi:hypothetical protein